MNVRATSVGMMLGTASTIVLSIMKAFAVGIVVGLAWWLVALPFVLVVAGLSTYAFWYMANIYLKRKKYQRRQENSIRK